MPHRQYPAALVALICFLSGACALVFETLWFRIAGTVLGSSVWSAAAVLMGFMLGVGIGNFAMAVAGPRVPKPFFAYALAEIAIGVTGVLVVFLLPPVSMALGGPLVAVVGYGALLDLLRFGFALCVLLVPAVAMGLTLPLLQKALHQRTGSYSSSLGMVYGWNTLGAVLGTLLTEVFLIEHLGIRGTAVTACLVNLSVAFVVIRAFPEIASVPSRRCATRWFGLRGKQAVIAAAFSTGFALLALEVIWFRYLLLSQSGSALVFAVMLAVILTGIGLGALVAGRLPLERWRSTAAPVLLPWLAAAAVVGSFATTGWLYEVHYGRVSDDLATFVLIAGVLMLPTSFLSGFLFALFGTLLYDSTTDTALATGVLTLANTLGAAAGAAVATFVLLPELGMERSLLLLSLLYVGIGWLTGIRAGVGDHRSVFRRASVAVVLGVLIVSVFPYGSVSRIYRAFGALIFPNETLVMVKEGVNETIQYYRATSLGRPYFYRLVTNNHSMSATGFMSRRYMALYAYFPLILKSDIADVLLVSYGVGNTAEAITSIDEVERLDVVDLSPEILEYSVIVHDHTGSYPLRDPRTRIYLEDGRFFLQTTSRRYDLITGEPPPPALAGVVNLYTREYFSLLRERLNPGGIVTYWLPGHSLDGKETLAVIKAFCLAFDNCSLWHGGGLNLMLVGSNGSLEQRSVQDFVAPWEGPLCRSLHAIGLENPGQFGTLFVADAAMLAYWTRNILPVSDDFPHRIAPHKKWSQTGSDRDSPKLYREMLRVERRRPAFEESSYIASLIPEPVRSETRRHWRSEEILTEFYLRSFMAIEFDYREALYQALERSDSHLLPTLLLFSTPEKQALLAGVDDDGSPAYQRALIIDAIVARDYELAAELLWHYIQAGVEVGPTIEKLYSFIADLAGIVNKEARG